MEARRSSPLGIFRISKGENKMNKGKVVFVELMLNEWNQKLPELMEVMNPQF